MSRQATVCLSAQRRACASRSKRYQQGAKGATGRLLLRVWVGTEARRIQTESPAVSFAPRVERKIGC